jgi:hypothetical protein
MATKGYHAQTVGMWIGGAVVVVGIATMIFGSLWIGLAAALTGLVALGGFAHRQGAERSRGRLDPRVGTGPSQAD